MNSLFLTHRLLSFKPSVAIRSISISATASKNTRPATYSARRQERLLKTKKEKLQINAMLNKLMDILDKTLEALKEGKKDWELFQRLRTPSWGEPHKENIW